MYAVEYSTGVKIYEALRCLYGGAVGDSHIRISLSWPKEFTVMALWVEGSMSLLSVSHTVVLVGQEVTAPRSFFSFFSFVEGCNQR